jgi:hypothetical protein
MHLPLFQGLETFGIDFDIVVIINCSSISNEYLVIYAMQRSQKKVKQVK